MVVEVRDPRPASPQYVVSSSTVTSSSYGSTTLTLTSPQPSTAGVVAAVATEETPSLYEPQDARRIYPLTTHLVDVSFIHLGSSFPFLRKEHFMCVVEDGRANLLLVNAVCAVSSRLSTHQLLWHDEEQNPAGAAKERERTDTFWAV